MIKQVTLSRTPAQIFEICIFLLVASLLLSAPLYSNPSGVLAEHPKLLTLLVCLPSLIGVSVLGFIEVKKRRWMKSRDSQLAQYAATHGWGYSPLTSTTKLSIAVDELGTRDERFTSVIGDESEFCGTYSHAIYHKTKHGEYKVRTKYMTVYRLLLPRALPNIFFDAVATPGKHFKRQFHHTQKHSFEGNFDMYFDSYIPTHYTIDTLSFITPEVMEALIAAKDYDIEIFGRLLYLYSPPQMHPDQFEDMLQKGRRIRDKLLNNILTYRDERVEYAQGRQQTSLVGFRLRKNLVPKYWSVAGGVAMVIAAAFVWSFSEGHGFVLTLMGAGTIVANIKDIRREQRYWTMLDSMHSSSQKEH